MKWKSKAVSRYEVEESENFVMRILWLKTELLHPIDKGGKIRTYQMLKELKREHHITYLTLDDGTAGENARELAREYCHELITIEHRTRRKFSAGFYIELAHNLVARLPYALGKYVSPEMRRQIENQTAVGKCDVLVCDFLTPSVNVPAQVDCATVLFQHNVEAMIWQRHYEVQKDKLKRLYLREQWRKTRAFERAACHRFDHTIAVSEEDAGVMRSDYGIKNVSAVPTGVDTEYFQSKGDVEVEPHNLVFTGSMDWLPNEDAIRFFTGEIMPRIRREIPDVTLTVVGRNPYPALVELSRRDASVIVTGRVDDVRPFMERAAAYVVPLRIGGGTRLKLYEAMAMEKAVISTRIGAEGLPVEDGSDVLLADSPEDFAASVVRVLKDESLRRELGERAKTKVRERFGWREATRVFVSACHEALATHESVHKAERARSKNLEQTV